MSRCGLVLTATSRSGPDHHGRSGDVVLDGFRAGLQHVQRRHVRLPGRRRLGGLRKLLG